MIYKPTRCKECDSLLWSDYAKKICLCPECEEVDQDGLLDAEEILDKLLIE